MQQHDAAERDRNLHSLLRRLDSLGRQLELGKQVQRAREVDTRYTVECVQPLRRLRARRDCIMNRPCQLQPQFGGRTRRSTPIWLESGGYRPMETIL